MTRLALVGCLLAACGGDYIEGVDPDIGGGDVVVEISASLDELTPSIDEIKISLEDLRISGDAPSEPVDMVELTWSDGPTEFAILPDFPIGRFSRVRATLVEFVASGEVALADGYEEWEINDEPLGGIDIDLEIALEVEPGGARISIVADIGAVLDAVDWELIEADHEVLRVDEDDEEIDQVREAVATELFELDTNGTTD